MVHSKWIICVCFFLFFSTKAENNHTKQRYNYVIIENKPLLVLSGYSSLLENISLEDLKKLYCEEKVYVLSTLKDAMDSLCQCKNNKIISRLEEFDKIAKNELLISDMDNIHQRFKALSVDGVNFFLSPNQYAFYLQNTISEIEKFSYAKLWNFLRNQNPNSQHYLSIKGNFIGIVYLNVGPENDFSADPRYYKFQGFFDTLARIKAVSYFDFRKNITKMIHTGVTAITRRTGLLADEKGIDFITEKVEPYFQNVDLVHISNEVSFLDECTYASAGTKFCTKTIHNTFFEKLHCNIVELTGNHNRDYGNEPFNKSFAWYQQKKIQSFGAGLNEASANEPLIVSMKDGRKLAFVGFNEMCPLSECAEGTTPGANRYSPEKAQKVLNYLKNEQKIDFIVASVQFRERDTYEPRPEQVQISKALIDFGADVVYGSQAHQVQQIEYHKNKVIYYGLGNFLFDQNYSLGVRQGFFLQHFFYNGHLVQSIPVYTMLREARPDLATESEAIEIKNAILKDELLYK